MVVQKHERFGLFDGFVRGMFAVGCLFLNVMLAAEMWRLTRDSAPGPGGAAAIGLFAGLTFIETLFYLGFWRDVKVVVTEANVKPTIIADEGDPVGIELLLHNPSVRDARTLGVEALVDGKSAGREVVDIAKDSIKSVTVTWAGKRGPHALKVMVEPGAGLGRRGRRIEVYEGEFMIRTGRRAGGESSSDGEVSTGPASPAKV